MITGNDFKQAIGNPDRNFENSVQQALNEVLMDEQRKNARGSRPLRFIIPAATLVAAAACAVIFIGSPGDQPDRVKSNNNVASQNTAQPVVAAESVTDEPAYSPEETEEAFAFVTEVPTDEPTAEPTAEHTDKPTVEPTAEPTLLPTPEIESTEKAASGAAETTEQDVSSADTLPQNHWMLQDTLNTDINSLYPGYTYTGTEKIKYGDLNWLVSDGSENLIACEYTLRNSLAELINNGETRLPTLTINLVKYYNDPEYIDSLMTNAAPWLSQLYTATIPIAMQSDHDTVINAISITFDENNEPRLCEMFFGRNREIYIGWKRDAGSDVFSIINLNSNIDRDWRSYTVTIKNTEPTEIIIADPVLEAAIRDVTGCQGRLTSSQLEAVTEIKITDTYISTLSGLEHCTNLEYLQLSGCGIDDDDLQYISGLTSLKTLLLGNNEITDISALEDLDLGWLHLSYNEITNIWPLAGMTNLKELYLDSNNLFGEGALNPIVNLTGLKTLYLQDCSISNIQPVIELAESIYLDELNICGNPISDYSTIANLDIPIMYYDE